MAGKRLNTKTRSANALTYHTDKNPLHKVTYKSEKVATAKSPEQRRLHKAFLRWHDPKNWPLLRKAMAEMGRQEMARTS